MPSFAWRTNGLAQRQRRDVRDAFLIIVHFWQITPVRERQSRCPTGAGVRRRYGFLQFSLFSALKFVGCWSLEERNPRFHRLFGNMETLLRILRIPYRKPSHQLLLRHIEKMHFTTRPKLLGSQPEIFAFLSCPEAEIEDFICSQYKRSTCYLPKQGLDQIILASCSGSSAS